MKVYPAVLTEYLDIAVAQLHAVQGLTDVVQLDVIDGQFVDNITLDPSDLTLVELGSLQADLHLMVVDPLESLVSYRGLPFVRSVIGQVERMPDLGEFVQEVKRQGWRAGLSLDVHTPVEAIDPAVLEMLDMIQVMGITVGWQGQEFQSSCLSKVKELSNIYTHKNSHPEIMVDGGVKPANIPELKAAGASAVVVGSFLWESKDLAKSWAELQNVA